jgi:stalled ribosome rescue protein Dom34
MLDECPNKVVYGEKEVFYAQDEIAIKDLLISSHLLKSTNFRIRKKFISFVE